MELSSCTITVDNTALDPNVYLIKQWQTWTGGLHQVLCMQGGDDDFSYVKNSEAPASAIAVCKPLLLNAIQSMKPFFHTKKEADSIRVADLGCATGRNTLATIDMVVESLRQKYLNFCGFEPEFEAFFSDLPSNDFNSLFQSLSSLQFSDQLQPKPRPYYAAGVPGSFYNRLFPKGKLHIAVSLSALHWLSKIPETVLDKRSPAWNKGRAWIEGSKMEVVEAYAEQSEKDLNDFLRCRREEIVEGGMLFILMGGRPRLQPPQNQLEDPDSRAKHPFTMSMDQAWQDLLNEGLVDEETRDGFNIPAYMRSVEEVERAIKRSGGFEIKVLEYKRIMEEKQEEWMKMKDPISYGRAKANLVRATLRPIVQAHLGPHLSDQLFNRFQRRVSSDFALLHKTCFYGVIVLCAIRISDNI